MLDKLHRNLVLAMKKGGWPVTFSIGVVTFEVAVETSRDALRRGGRGDVRREALW